MNVRCAEHTAGEDQLLEKVWMFLLFWKIKNKCIKASDQTASSSDSLVR